MKGLTLDYVFVMMVGVAVICVAVAIIAGFLKPEFIFKPKWITEVKYACSKYNNSKINLENLKVVIYGFLTGQCNDFYSQLTQDIKFEDVKRIVGEIDGKVNVILLRECEFLKTNTHSVYVCCDKFESGESINIKRREIKNSDVLVCKK
ncbi:MAG: hypothetical protein QXG39_07870 [Candidatus Aenigmatarchaeota archaeon]